MEFSKALPVEFWPVILRSSGGTQTLRILFTDPTYASINTPTTFNELQNQPGVMAAPYYSPMDSGDPIVLQFTAPTGGDYRLNMIRDDDHALIFNQAFSEVASGVYQITASFPTDGRQPSGWGKYQFSVASRANAISSNILAAIAGPAWANQVDGGEDWAMAAGAATVTLETTTSPNSNRLKHDFADTLTTETLHVGISGTTAQSAGRDVRGYIEFRFYKDGAENTTLRRRVPFVHNRNSNSGLSTGNNFACRLLMPAGTIAGIDSVSFSAHITSCDQTVNADSNCLFTVNQAIIATYSDNMIIYAKSDHHDFFSGGWDELEAGLYNSATPKWPVARPSRATVLLKYYNTDPFAGLDFSSSPGPFFYLRVPGTFLHEAFEREEESHELSSDEWLTVWSELSAKKKLEISHIPYYIIRKLNLILMMDFINVGEVNHTSFENNDYAGENRGMDVVARDPVEVDDGNRRYPLKNCTVMLTDKEFIKRNLL